MLRSISPISAKATFILFHTELLLVLFHRMVPSLTSSSSSSNSNNGHATPASYAGRTVRLGEPFSRLVAMVLDWLLYEGTSITSGGDSEATATTSASAAAAAPLEQPQQSVPTMLSTNSTAQEVFKAILAAKKAPSSSSTNESSSASSSWTNESFLPSIVIKTCKACLDAGAQYVRIAPEHQEKLLQLVTQQAKSVAHFIELTTNNNNDASSSSPGLSNEIVLMHALVSRLKCLDIQLMSLEEKLSQRDKDMLFGTSNSNGDDDTKKQKEQSPSSASMSEESKAKIVERKLQKAIFVRDQAILKVRTLIHRIQDEFEKASPSSAVSAAKEHENNNSSRYNLILGYFKSKNEARVSLLSDLGLQSALASTYGEINEPYAKIFRVISSHLQHHQTTQTKSSDEIETLFQQTFGGETFSSLFPQNLNQQNSNRQHLTSAVKVLGALIKIKESKSSSSPLSSFSLTLSFENWKNFLMSDWIELRPIAIAMSKKLSGGENSPSSENNNNNSTTKKEETIAASASPAPVVSAVHQQQQDNASPSIPRSGDYLLALMDQQ